MSRTTQRLRAVREANGFSLARISRETGINKSHLSRIERGLQRPTIPALVRICRAIGLDSQADAIDRLWP